MDIERNYYLFENIIESERLDPLFFITDVNVFESECSVKSEDRQKIIQKMLELTSNFHKYESANKNNMNNVLHRQEFISYLYLKLGDYESSFKYLCSSLEVKQKANAFGLVNHTNMNMCHFYYLKSLKSNSPIELPASCQSFLDEGYIEIQNGTSRKENKVNLIIWFYYVYFSMGVKSYEEVELNIQMLELELDETDRSKEIDYIIYKVRWHKYIYIKTNKGSALMLERKIVLESIISSEENKMHSLELASNPVKYAEVAIEITKNPLVSSQVAIETLKTAEENMFYNTILLERTNILVMINLQQRILKFVIEQWDLAEATTYLKSIEASIKKLEQVVSKRSPEFGQIVNKYVDSCVYLAWISESDLQLMIDELMESVPKDVLKNSFMFVSAFKFMTNKPVSMGKHELYSEKQKIAVDMFNIKMGEPAKNYAILFSKILEFSQSQVDTFSDLMLIYNYVAAFHNQGGYGNYAENFGTVVMNAVNSFKGQIPNQMAFDKIFQLLQIGFSFFDQSESNKLHEFTKIWDRIANSKGKHSLTAQQTIKITFAKAIVLIKIGKIAKALEFLQILEKNPNCTVEQLARVKANLGVCKIQIGDKNQALVKFKQSIALYSSINNPAVKGLEAVMKSM